MGKRQRYTDQFRAAAIVALTTAGYPDREGSLIQVSRDLDVPSATLHRWFHSKSNPPPSEIVIYQKRELHEILRDLAYKIAESIPNAMEGANIQQLSTSLGIVIDKMQLLDKQPTERVEHQFTDTERAERIAALFDAARTRRDRRDSEERIH